MTTKPRAQIFPVPIPTSGKGAKIKYSTVQGYPIIQYFFDDSTYDNVVEYRLRSAMDKIEQVSCVRFQRVTEAHRDYSKTLLRISNPNHVRECSHKPVIQHELNVVQLVLGLDCLQERDVLHSLLHVIGLEDEISHPDRDKYVRVMWDNVNPRYRKLFRIQNNVIRTTNPVEYDPMSIMQFHDRAYTRNGRPTIVPVMAGLTVLPSDDLSALDKLKLRLMFGQACNQRRLTELIDSCKLTMDGGKPKVDEDDNNEDDNNEDEDDNIFLMKRDPD